MALVGLLLLNAGQARADLVDYDYQVQVSPGVPLVDFSSAHIAVLFQADTQNPATFGILNVQASIAPGSPARTYDDRVTMAVELFDLDTMTHGVMNFDAVLSGTLTPTSSSLVLTFAHPDTQWLNLGGYEWGVTLDRTVLPVPSPTTWGGANLEATLKVTHGPEPSALLLAAAGGLVLAARRWRVVSATCSRQGMQGVR
jgi:hypothetical protein